MSEAEQFLSSEEPMDEQQAEALLLRLDEIQEETDPEKKRAQLQALLDDPTTEGMSIVNDDFGMIDLRMAITAYLTGTPLPITGIKEWDDRVNSLIPKLF
jgi:hypothetical protein